MAFATSNVRVSSVDGQTYLTTGNWTGNVGDAAGSVKAPGARLLEAVFYNNLASGGPAQPVYGTGSGTLPITVTVGPYNANVTAGTFKIISQ